MGNTQKKLFLWAGIFSGITSALNLIAFILLNFVFKSFYAELLTILQSDMSSNSMFGSYKTYYNSLLIVSFAINLYLSFKYISYSRMSIRKLTQKSRGLFGLLLINAFCGGNIVALILSVIAMSKPITPSFNDKSIKEIDRSVLDNNPNTVAKILKIKQDKLNGLINDEEYKDSLNKILEEEARKYLWKIKVVLYLK